MFTHRVSVMSFRLQRKDIFRIDLNVRWGRRHGRLCQHPDTFRPGSPHGCVDGAF